MISTIRHKGLKLYFLKGDRRLLPPNLVVKIIEILDDLNAALDPEDMNLPKYRLHLLGGNLAGFWSVRVSRNWRIIFRFDGSNVCDVDLVDYH